MHLNAPISPGEFLDKLTILEIKAERIGDPAKLLNVRRELDLLRAQWTASPMSAADVSTLVAELKHVNETLWEIEDKIRDREARAAFDAAFIELARSVYLTNDRRAEIKRAINLALSSDLIEEKSYADHGRS
jgi:post-segregation antitoxin (ccd killing protein)